MSQQNRVEFDHASHGPQLCVCVCVCVCVCTCIHVYILVCLLSLSLSLSLQADWQPFEDRVGRQPELGEMMAFTGMGAI